MEKEPEIVVDEARSDPPVQGPSNIVKVISKKGKIHVVKREGDVEVETEVEAENPTSESLNCAQYKILI